MKLLIVALSLLVAVGPDALEAVTFSKTSTPTVTITSCSSTCKNDLTYVVCGSDGVTYLSDCIFQQALCRNKNLKMVQFGPCTNVCTKICNRVVSPVCDSNGRTYANKCLFQNAKCTNSSLVLASNSSCA